MNPKTKIRFRYIFGAFLAITCGGISNQVLAESSTVPNKNPEAITSGTVSTDASVGKSINATPSPVTVTGRSESKADSPQVLKAGKFLANIFDQDGNKDEVVLKFEAGRKPVVNNAVADASKVTEALATAEWFYYTSYIDLSGQTLLSEKAWIKDNRLQRYEFEDNQLGQKASSIIDYENKKLKMHFEEKGTVKDDLEDLEVPNVAGPSIIQFLTANLDVLEKDEDVSFHYQVLDRLTAYKFKFSLISKDEKSMKVKLSASSFILKPFVSPITFTMDTVLKTVMMIEGRCPVKRKVGNELKEFKMRTVVYKNEAI